MAQPEAGTIGAGTSVSGQVTGRCSLVVHGRVEGSLTLDADLTVESGGHVAADVSVQRLLVRGTLSGSVIASEAVVVEAGATLLGDVRTPRISIQDGARFKGSIDMDVPAGSAG